ncbi:MAG: winged helix-turn-helix domain-containing protein [Gemmatimonadaceae bacterium]|nr:winged helix-turn-helix domain-containing protein [Gemmatimonadaceae bacterium]
MPTTTKTKPATSAKDAKVSGREALIRVLKKAGEPMKMKDLAAKALKMKGVRLKGKTPEQTLAAILAIENGKPDGLFERVAPGTYRLRQQ